MHKTIKDMLDPNNIINKPTRVGGETQTRVYVNTESMCYDFIKHGTEQIPPALDEEYVAELSPENQKRVRDDYARLLKIYDYAEKTGKEVLFVALD